jgi:hypothetical protein
MTTFSYPLEGKRPEMTATGAGAVKAKIPFYMIATVSVGQTGTAVGSTTIPLFIAPAGSRVIDAFLDITTAADPGEAGTRTGMAVGTSTSTGIIYASTTVNTAGRRTYGGSSAQVSANAIVFSADTTIQALVSIDTSVISAFQAIVNVVLV